MMVLATGTYWKAEYGEISDNLEFRIGYVGQDSWDAYFPIGQLSDLIAVLNGVTPLSVGGLYQGSQLQARKVSTGFKVFVSIEPKSNLYPVQIIRFEDSLTSDLISTLTSLQGLIPLREPSSWDIISSYAALSDTVTDKIAVPQSVYAVGPAASGDTSGVTDTLLLTIALQSGKVIHLPEDSIYYVNATLPLKQYGGLSMSRGTKINWVGPAGGTVLSTVPFTSGSQPAFYGVVEGGEIIYPYSLLTSSSRAVYIAQPLPSKTLTTRISTDRVDYSDIGVPTISGSAGWELDGNTNPGPFSISSVIHGQFDKQIWARASHVNAIHCQGAYGGSLIVFDSDSLNLAIPAINCMVQSPHAFANHVAVVRIVKGRSITVIGGLNEPDQADASGLGMSVILYIESTFTGFVTLINHDSFISSSMKHYSTTGVARIESTQGSYQATFTGNTSTGVAVETLLLPQKRIFVLDPTRNITSSTPVSVIYGNTPLKNGVNGRFGVRLVCKVKVSNPNSTISIGIYHSGSYTAPGNPVSGYAVTQTTKTIALENNEEIITLEWVEGGQNTTAYFGVGASVSAGTITVSGVCLTVEAV